MPNASHTAPNHTQVSTAPRPLLNDHRTTLSASRLPSDIWFLIFDELAEVSPGTLKACASVSRSLSSLAQRYTFSRIRLRGNRGFNKWSSHIMPDDSEPGLSHYVKRIHYNCYMVEEDEDLDQDSNRCLPYLTNVQTLWLDGADFKHMPNFAALGSNIRVIDLRRCRMAVDNLLAFLCSFERLEDFTISYPRVLRVKHTLVGRVMSMTMRQSSPTPGRSPSNPLPLRRLKLSEFPDNDPRGRQPDVMKLKHFLAFPAKALTEIRLHSDWGPFDLTGMTELTCASFEGLEIDQNLESLQTLSSRKLATLRLSLPERHVIYPILNTDDWEQLNRVLEGVLRRIGGKSLDFYVWVDVTTDHRRGVEMLVAQFISSFNGHQALRIWYERCGSFPAIRIG